MAKKGALDLTIRISGKIDKSLQASINSAQSQIGSFTKGISIFGKAALAGITAAGTGLAFMLADCTKEAQNAESAMAPVVRYVDNLADSTGKVSDAIADNGKTFKENYSMMKAGIQDLTTQVPRTFDQLTQISASLGQSGIGLTDQLKGGVLRDTAIAATAMDLDDETAGNYMAKWQESFNMSHKEVMTLMDQINYLGANNATIAGAIAESVNRSASMGQIAGVNPAATAAMATAMQATGVSPERTGTSIARIYTNVSKGENATDAQKAMWEELGFSAEGIAKSMQTDGVGTLRNIFHAIGNMPNERKVAALNTLFGQWAIEGGAKIVNNLPLYEKALEDVQNPKLYEGSMQKEFVIQAGTTESLDIMMNNAKVALKQDVGEELLPVKRTIDFALIDLMNNLRKNMPQIKELAGTFGDLLSAGITKMGASLDVALPYIQKGLDYLVNNGEQAARILGIVTAAFGTMAFAPQIEGGLRGVGSFLFGKNGAGGIVGGGGSGGYKGGIIGALSSMYRGGQNVAGKAGALWGVASMGAGLANSSLTDAKGNLSVLPTLSTPTNTQLPDLHHSSFLEKMENGFIGAFFGLKNRKGLLGPDKGKRGRGNPFFSSFTTTMDQITNAKNNGGILGMITGAFNASPVGKYVGGVRNAAGNMANTAIGGSILNGLKGTGGAVKEILAGIFSEEGILPRKEDVELVKGVFGLMKDNALGKAGALASSVANSGFGQAVGGVIGKAAPVVSGIAGKGATLASGAVSMAGNIGSFASAGAGLLGSIWGPAAGGFGSLFVGSLPIVGAISGVIAVLSILYDNLDGVRNLIGKTFGDQGLAVFDTFKGGLDSVLSFITGLFQEGGVETALQPVQDAITNMFGADAGAAFGGVVQILQSVMGVVGQIVNFATTTVKPIITEIFTFITGTVMPIILQTFTDAAPIISAIITNLGSAIMTGMQIIGSAIQYALPFIEQIITVIMSIASIAIPAVLAGFSIFSEGISAVITAVQGIFEGLITFITGVFSGNWAMAWDGVKQIFSSAFDALVELCKTPINAVISLINSAIGGLNKIKVTIPSWVPDWGGKEFGINLPTIPMLARGGFTNGVSIAGEAGTEAVISFQSGVRDNNIATWMKAGQMLGVDMTQAMEAAGGNASAMNLAVLDSGRNKGVDLITDIGSADRQGGDGGGIAYAPQIIIQGNADRDVLEEALRIAQERFEKWYEQMQRRKARVAY